MDSAEIIDAESEEVQEAVEALPERNPENDKPLARKKKEIKRVEDIKAKKPKSKKSKDRAKRYQLLQRAKKVGLEPLPSRRPSNSERRKWIEELIEREESMKSRNLQA